MTLNQLPTRKQILANFATLLSGMGLARIMTALALILVARQVGPDSYGQFVACYALAKLTSVAFSWGLDGWLLWRGGKTPDHRTLAVQSGNALVWKLLLGVVWFAGLSLLPRWLNPEVYSPSVLLLAGLIVWTEDLTNTVWSVFKSTLQNDVTFKLITSVQFSLLITTGALVFADAQSLSVFMWARFVVSAIGCLGAIYMLRRNIGLGYAASKMIPIFRASTPFAASLILALIIERADVTIVGQFLGKAQVGIYGPASIIATTLFLIPASAYSVMVPVFTRAHGIDAAAFARSLRLFVVVNTLLGIGLAAGLALSADWIVSALYGPQYEAAAPILAILSLVLGLRCVTFALAAAVVGAGRQSQRLYAQAAAAGLNVALNLAIVSVWGIRGVAWVYVLTEVVVLVGYWLALGPARPRLLPRAPSRV